MKELFLRYHGAVIAVVTTDNNNDDHIGSAFHVGDGVFVTAAHVAENQVSCRVLLHNEAEIQIKPLPHPDRTKDVAVFRVPELVELPTIPLGGHLDDWLSVNEFVLDDVLVLGYPPIPLSKRPVLVAATGQVNAVVDLINVEHVHFVISVLPKGGFSGGVVVSEWDFALGVITNSLVKNGSPEELGYLTVLTVEPILQCLGAHELIPKELAQMWDGLFTSKQSYFGLPAEGWAQAWLETDRDGHRTRLQFACPNPNTVLKAHKALLGATTGVVVLHEIVPEEVHMFKFQGDYASLQVPLKNASQAVTRVFIEDGFLPVERPSLIHRSLTR